jgi:hypothetical protein
LNALEPFRAQISNAGKTTIVGRPRGKVLGIDLPLDVGEVRDLSGAAATVPGGGAVA